MVLNSVHHLKDHDVSLVIYSPTAPVVFKATRSVNLSL